MYEIIASKTYNNAFFYFRITEKWYTEDGQCMPMPKSFRQAPTIKPVRLLWSVTSELENEINKALHFAEAVSVNCISIYMYRKCV